MKSGPSALTAIGGFGVLVTILNVATTASIVLLVPDPPALRMTVADAAAALRGTSNGLERRSGPVPSGVRAPVLEEALARTLDRPLSTVRVVWLGSSNERNPATYIVLEPQTPGPRPNPPVVRVRRAGQNESANAVASPVVLLDALQVLPQPGFAAGFRQTNGEWVSVTPASGSWGGWRLKVVAALGISLLLLAPLAWLFARRLTQPFRVFAQAIDTGKEPPAAAGPRELREAGAAITALRSRVSAELEERLRMLIAVAHDLRTPLTSMRLRLESVAEPQRTRLSRDAERMQAMIEDVLTFARVTDVSRHSVLVRPLVQSVINEMPGASRTMRLDDGPDLSVSVVQEAFRRAVENLVRNAIDYAGGGVVRLSSEENQAVLTISDNGPGIAEIDRARLIHPFERGEASRNRNTGGVGLGLSIVASFVATHDGSLTLGEVPGGGTLVTIRIPVDHSRMAA